MIKTVYLDMDGILVNFVGAVNKYMGIPKDTIPTKWNWVKDYGFTFDDVNSWCDINFWHTLDWTYDGHDIIRLVVSTFKPEQIYLLTTPMPNPGSYTGKALWVQSHLPEYNKRLIVTPVPKSLFATPSILLIDDKDENVEEFVKAGGYGILVNRPWNKGYERVDHTVEDLEIDLLGVVRDIEVNNE